MLDFEWKDPSKSLKGLKVNIIIELSHKKSINSPQNKTSFYNLFLDCGGYHLACIEVA